MGAASSPPAPRPKLHEAEPPLCLAPPYFTAQTEVLPGGGFQAPKRPDCPLASGLPHLGLLVSSRGPGCSVEAPGEPAHCRGPRRDQGSAGPSSVESQGRVGGLCPRSGQEGWLTEWTAQQGSSTARGWHSTHMHLPEDRPQGGRLVPPGHCRPLLPSSPPDSPSHAFPQGPALQREGTLCASRASGEGCRDGLPFSQQLGCAPRRHPEDPGEQSSATASVTSGDLEKPGGSWDLREGADQDPPPKSSPGTSLWQNPSQA